MSIRDRIEESFSNHGVYSHEIDADSLIDEIIYYIGTCETCEFYNACSIQDHFRETEKGYCSEYKRSKNA